MLNSQNLTTLCITRDTHAQRMSRCCTHVLVSQARPSPREGLACETTHVSRHFLRVHAADTYVQVERWANRLHAARIGSYSGWPPLRCVRTASPTSRTIVVQGGLRLLADGDGRLSSDIPKRYTGARDTTFARSARNNWIPKRDGYIHTISEMRRRISCLTLRRSAKIIAQLQEFPYTQY